MLRSARHVFPVDEARIGHDGHDMSKAERTTNNVEPLFHPVSHYDTPGDVVNDARLSTDEKRVILSLCSHLVITRRDWGSAADRGFIRANIEARERVRLAH